MNVKISDLMAENVISVEPNATIGDARRLFQEKKLHAVPVIADDGVLAGILSTQDLVTDARDDQSVHELMTEHVYTIPQYNDVHHAARLMRNHKVHHVIVTHEKQVVGILSSFDLLKLVEDHRFVMKQSPGQKKRGPKRQ